jgi:hypothetical protein
MSKPLTEAEARAFRNRWRKVNAREVEEMRQTSMDVKLQQFNTLLPGLTIWGRPKTSPRGNRK